MAVLATQPLEIALPTTKMAVQVVMAVFKVLALNINLDAIITDKKRL